MQGLERDGPEPNPLIKKLEQKSYLTQKDRIVLAELFLRSREIGAHTSIARRGEQAGTLYLMLEGLACRCQIISERMRQISGFMMPGGFCNLPAAFLDGPDHDLVALTTCKVAVISRPVILRLIEAHPRIAHALWCCTLIDESIQREWFINNAHRPADRRMAHLFCELLVRGKAAGLTQDDSYDFPLSQSELGEVLGISAVHANRTIQALRSDGLVRFQHKFITIINAERLKAFCGFDPAYLHLKQQHTALLE